MLITDKGELVRLKLTYKPVIGNVGDMIEFAFCDITKYRSHIVIFWCKKIGIFTLIENYTGSHFPSTEENNWGIILLEIDNKPAENLYSEYKDYPAVAVGNREDILKEWKTWCINDNN